MNCSQFASKIGRIEFEHGIMTRQGKKVLQRLVDRVGAAHIINQGRITGWRLPNGQVVCRKRRYPSDDVAVIEMQLIVHRSRRGKVPVRAYECPICKGFHLTSRQ
jgi:hypothetical protein